MGFTYNSRKTLIARRNEVRDARLRRDLDQLVDALRETDGDIRRLAAWSLGILGDPKAVKPLVRCLDAHDDALKVNALHALGKIGDLTVIPRLREIAVGSDEFRVRAAAMAALARLGDASGVASLASIIINPDLSRTYAIAKNRVGPSKRWASHQLVELGARDAIPILEQAKPPAGILERWRINRTIRALRRVDRSVRKA